MGERLQKESVPRPPEYAFTVRELQASLFSAYSKGARGSFFVDSIAAAAKSVPGARSLVGPRMILQWLEASLAEVPSHPKIDGDLRKRILDFCGTLSSDETLLMPQDFFALAKDVKRWLDTHLLYEDIVFLDQDSAAHFAKALQKINPLVYCRYSPKDRSMELHISSVRCLPPIERLRLFREGMEGLKAEVRKEIAQGYPVEAVRGTSWIVAASPESVERYGFHVLLDERGRPTDTCELIISEAWLNSTS